MRSGPRRRQMVPIWALQPTSCMADVMLEVMNVRVVLAERLTQRVLELKLKHFAIVPTDLLCTSLRPGLKEPRTLQQNWDGVADAVSEHPRTPVVCDMIDFGECDRCASQAGFDGLVRKADVVLRASKLVNSLLFSRVNELAVPEKDSKFASSAKSVGRLAEQTRLTN